MASRAKRLAVALAKGLAVALVIVTFGAVIGGWVNLWFWLLGPTPWVVILTICLPLFCFATTVFYLEGGRNG